MQIKKLSVLNRGLSSSWASFIPFSIMMMNIVFHLRVMWGLIFSRRFDPDEFQHTHIAWLIFRGETIYKDFFDNHGPLYAELNALLFHFLDEPASFDTLMTMRIISFFGIFVTAVGVYMISRQLNFSRLAALFSVCAYYSWYFVTWKGIEIRPDIIQNIFWVFGLYFFLRWHKNSNHRLMFFVGMLWGLMALCNLKGVVGCTGILLYMCLYQRPLKYLLKQILWMLLGGLTVAFPFVVSHLMNGSLESFIYYNTWYQFDMSNADFRPSVKKRMLKFLVEFDMANLLLAGLGLLCLRRRFHSMIAIVLAIAATYYGVHKGLYAQYYLINLPLLSILCGFGFWRLTQISLPRKGLIIVISTALVLICSDFSPFYNKMYPKRGSRIAMAKKSMNWVIENIDREMKLGFRSKGDCGGWVFNNHLDYHWAVTRGVSSIKQVKHKEMIIAAKPEVIVSRDSRFTETGYRRAKDNSQCIWIREDSILE